MAAASANIAAVGSRAEFERARPAGGLSVVFFWADWHPPSRQMLTAVEEAAKTNPEVLFFEVEAEKAPDVTEMFPVVSVPTTVFCRGDKTLQVLEGADVPAFVAAVRKHSTTTVPAVAAAAAAGQDAGVSDSRADLSTRLAKLVAAAPVMLFMKGSPQEPRCKFSRQMVEVLREAKVSYGYFDVLTDERVREGLKEFSNWPTYPQLYISGRLVGGLDIVKELHESGELAQQLPKSASADDLKARLKALINQKRVMLFMKGSPQAPQCGFSAQMAELLNKAGFRDYGYFDILTDNDVRQGLKEFSNWPTYPQLYVDGKLIGGLDVAQEMFDEGELQQLAKQ